MHATRALPGRSDAGPMIIGMRARWIFSRDCYAVETRARIGMLLQDAKLKRQRIVVQGSDAISDCWAVGDVSGAVQGPGTWTGHVDVDSVIIAYI